MPIHVACGGCDKRLLVESRGISITCPRCGQPVKVPNDSTLAESSGLFRLVDDGSEEFPEDLETAEVVLPSPEVGSNDSTANSAERTANSEHPADGEEHSEKSPPAEAVPTFAPVSDAEAGLGEQTPDFHGSCAPVEVTVVEASHDAGDQSTVDRPGPLSGKSAEVVSASASSPAASGADKRQTGISPGLFVAVLSYASAVTIALLYCLYRLFAAGPHPLESLPDLPPAQTNAFYHIREDAEMPPLHTLRLQESRRFGDVRVTPLRVTRGPLELVDFNDREQTQTTSGSVLKLWLKFENQSTSQTFAPLDLPLMLWHEFDRQNPERVLSNNFVCKIEEKHPAGDVVHVYPLNPNDRWDLKGPAAGGELAPQESQVVFIPTAQQGVDALQGDLVWRVHFRKGCNHQTQRGVTTLIEVVFNSEQIENAAIPEQPAPNPES